MFRFLLAKRGFLNGEIFLFLTQFFLGFVFRADRSFLEWFLPESVIVLVTFVGADETMPRHVTTGVLLLVTGASIHPKGPKRTQKDPKGTQKDPKGPKIN